MTSETPETPPVIDPGPFAPPEDFEHSAAFLDDVPRPLPAFARRSRYLSARRTTVWSLLTVAAACWVTAPIPFVQTMSWYILPLGYLSWCGLGLAALAAIVWFRNLTTWGLLDYLRRGEPLIGRVREVGIQAGGTQEAPVGQFVSAVEFHHPETSELQTFVLSAPDTFPLGDAPKMSAGVEPGDYVTLVYLPGQIDQSMRLYGWLGIDPEHDYITKNGKRLETLSSLAVLMIVVAVTVALWVLLSFIYVLEAYSPLDGDWKPYVIGISLASLPWILLFQWTMKGDSESKTPILVRRLGFALLGIFCGLMSGFPTVGFVNGYFDRSPRDLQPVRIVQLWHTTWNFIIRNYELEYEPFPNGKATKQTVPVETMSQFESNDLGVIDIGRGNLGMRWIRSFHPIVWHDVTDDPDAAIPGTVRCRLTGDNPAELRLAPQVMIDNATFAPIPDAMYDAAYNQILSRLKSNPQVQILKEEP